MRNRMYGGVRGRKTKVGEKLFRFPPTRLLVCKIVVENICKVLDFCNFASPLLNYSNK